MARNLKKKVTVYSVYHKMLKVCCIVVYSIMETRDAISNPVSSMNQDVLKACHGYGKLTATNPY